MWLLLINVGHRNFESMDGLRRVEIMAMWINVVVL